MYVHNKRLIILVVKQGLYKSLKGVCSYLMNVEHRSAVSYPEPIIKTKKRLLTI